MGRAITFLVLNSIRDVEKSVVPVTYLFPSSKFFNVTDAEVRIMRPKTCIFILLKRKDITDQSHHYQIFRKYVNLCAMGENHLYTER